MRCNVSGTPNLVNQRFNRLTVLERSPEKTKIGKVQWICQCDCGTKILAYTGALRTGNTKSCGCLRVDVSRRNGLLKTTHGMTRTPEYKVWQNLKDRCYNEEAVQYPNYGGRGIRVCERWLESFENFLADMGLRPGPGYSIDRENNDGHYEPGNCRWATSDIQANNRRVNKYYEFEGEQLTIPQIAKKLRIPPATLAARLRYGMSPDEAFTRKFHKKYFDLNGTPMSVKEVADHYGLKYLKVYRHLITLGKPIEDLAKIKEK